MRQTCQSAAATTSRRLRRSRGAVPRAGRRRCEGAIENAAGIYLPDRLHEVRIAVKKLRYAMEIARELSRSRADARIRTLKKAQDLLGRMHDLEMLIARTRAVQGAAGAATLRLSARPRSLVRQLETECRQLHGQLHGACARGCSPSAIRSTTGRRGPANPPPDEHSCRLASSTWSATPSPPNAATSGPTTTSVR